MQSVARQDPYQLLIAERDQALVERDLHKRDAHQQRQVVDWCQQVAGKALGYPWFKDDQKNFPGSEESHGVCIGEHVEETIIEELASAYRDARREVAVLQIQGGRLKEEREEARALLVRDEAVIAENAEMMLRWREASTQALLALEPLILSGQYRALLLGALSEILPDAVNLLRRAIARPDIPLRETIENLDGVTYNDRHHPHNLNG